MTDEKSVTIRVGGPLIEISKDGSSPIEDSGLLNALLKKLSFMRRNFNYVTGEKDFELISMYVFDDKGRLVCQKGWFDAICKILDDYGYKPIIIDERRARESAYTEDWDAVLKHFVFRPMQKLCLAKIVSRIRKRLGGIVEAAPAFGKTKLISMVCALYPKAKIDVISYGNELLDDIRRHILQHTPNVGRAYGGYKSEDRITVISSMSLSYIRPDADLVLVDEVHKLATDRCASALGRYQDACMFGFSATPKARLDNLHQRLEALFGPIIFSTQWQEATSAGLLVPILVDWRDVHQGTTVSRYYQNQVLRKRFAYWRNHERNHMIASAARSYYEQGMQVLILVETIEHALFLRELLPEFEVCFSGLTKGTPQFRRLQGLFPNAKLDVTAMRRRELKSRFENRDLLGAIATPIWATGVSFDGLQVLIRADGGGSEINCHQWPGRVARIDPVTGKRVGVVVDFLDKFDQWTYQRSLFRRRIYTKNGWTQMANLGNKISKLLEVDHDPSSASV